MSEQDEPRYFTLTQEALVPYGVQNYFDRLCGKDGPLVFKKGSRFVFRDGEYWTYEAFGYALDERQAAIVEPLLMEAESRIGQWLEASCGTYEAILAALGELGIVKEDDIKKAAALIDQDSEDWDDDIEGRNWVIVYPEG